MSCHCNSSASTKPEIGNPLIFASADDGEGDDDDVAEEVSDADDDEVGVDNKAGVVVADAGVADVVDADEDEEIRDEYDSDGVLVVEAARVIASVAAAFSVVIDNEVVDEDIGNEQEDNSLLIIVVEEVFSYGSI